MEIIYREMITSDRDRIIDLFNDFCNLYIEMDLQKININTPNLPTWCLDNMMKEINKTQGKVIVAEDNNKVVGFVGFYIREAKEDELLYHRPYKFGLVYNLFVDKSYRNKKIGSHLLKLAEDYFKENNCEFSKLQVFGTNDKAYKLYERNNYTPRNIDLIKKL